MAYSVKVYKLTIQRHFKQKFLQKVSDVLNKFVRTDWYFTSYICFLQTASYKFLT